MNQLQTIPAFWFQLAFFAAAAFALFMALIPGHADPTGFINDKLKHALVFIVLCAMLDLAFPSVSALWKVSALLVFGVFIEICQKMTGYRHFSIGDIVADALGIGFYWAIRLTV